MRLEVAASIRRRSGFALEVARTCDAGALGVVGPSGSGKSTLLDAIAGVERGARVVLDGRDRSRLRLERREVGYVMQDPLLFPHLSVRRNLGYSPRADGAEVERIAALLGIGALLDRMPRNLSGGERRRVALARALASRPALLLLDEPFAGLDEARRREAMSLLAHVRGRLGVPLVLVTHVAEEVVALADWAVRLEAGRVVAAGPSASVLRAGETRIDNFFTGSVVGPGAVRAGEVELRALLPEGARGEVRLACRAEDVVLALEIPRGVSARNCFFTTVEAVLPAAGAVLVALRDPPIRAVVTAEAAQALDLRPGGRVAALVKATAIAFMGNA